MAAGDHRRRSLRQLLTRPKIAIDLLLRFQCVDLTRAISLADGTGGRLPFELSAAAERKMVKAISSDRAEESVSSLTKS